MRRILELVVQGRRLVGTYHEPQAGEGGKPRAPGVLFVNFGQTPRSGLGDLAAHLGDRLAESGYGVFRFDLPGLGDSPGDLPETTEAYWRFVQDDGEGPITASLSRVLRERYALPGVILGGLCGGAITSIYAATRHGAAAPGLILLEPYFNVTPVEEPAGAPAGGASASAAASATAKLRSFRSSLAKSFRSARERTVTSAKKAGRVIIPSPLFDLAKSARSLIRSVQLPPDANVPLIAAYRRLAAGGPPVLVLTLKPKRGQPFNRDIVRFGPQRAITWHEVPNTNHMFAIGGGRQAVGDLVDQWLRREFPVEGLARPREVRASAAVQKELVRA